jgi:O-antigen/teichoic acid export membrane protein
MFRLKKYLDYGYFKNFILLLSGTILAQFITVVFSPVLSRQYSPTEFGIFAAYSSTISIVSVICCGRYELSIILPDEISKAFRLVNLCVIMSFAVSIISIPIVSIIYFSSSLSNSDYIIILPLVIIVSALNISLIYFHNKIQNFKFNSISKVIQSGTVGVISFLVSVYFKKYGLIIGALIGQFACTIYLFIRLPGQFKRNIFDINDFYLKVNLAKEFIHFPKFTLIPSFLNMFSSQSINYFLILSYGSFAAGNYFFASKMILLPASLISGSFTDIFFQKVVERKAKQEKIYPFLISNLIYLLLIASFFFVMFYFLAPVLFDEIFGEKWIAAGKLCSIIAFSMFVRLVISPLTMIFTALDKVKIGARWQYVYFITFNISLLLLFWNKVPFMSAIKFLTIFDLFIYIIALFFITKVAKSFDDKKLV